MAKNPFGVIPNSSPVYADPSQYYPPGTREVHSVAAPPVVVVSPPEMSNVLYQLMAVLTKMEQRLEAESYEAKGDCVEVCEVVRDPATDLIIRVEKRKEYLA